MKSPNEQALSMVQYFANYLLEDLSEHCSLQQKIYCRWAATELISRMEENEYTPPLVTIEEFRDQMDEYSHICERTSHVFTYAKYMAETIIDLLIS